MEALLERQILECFPFPTLSYFSNLRGVNITMKKNEWLSNTKVVDANGNPLIVYHGSEVAWRKYDSSKAPDSHSTHGKSNHIYFSSKKEVAETYLEKYPIYKDVPFDKLSLLTMYRDTKNDIYYFAECDIKGVPTGLGLKPKELLYDHGYYFERPLNGILEPIPKFDPTVVRKFQYLAIMNQQPNGEYDISDFDKYEKVHHTGNSMMRCTHNLEEDIIYAYQHGEEYHFELKGVVRPFYVNLENPFIIDAKRNNAVIPFTDEHGRKWGHAGEYSYQRYTPIEAIEDYAKQHGYDGVIVKNIKDIGRRPDKDIDVIADTIIAFSPNQIKLVTNKELKEIESNSRSSITTKTKPTIVFCKTTSSDHGMSR